MFPVTRIYETEHAAREALEQLSSSEVPIRNQFTIYSSSPNAADQAARQRYQPFIARHQSILVVRRRVPHLQQRLVAVLVALFHDRVVGRGGFQIAAHALAKITLFFCAGAILVAAHKTEVSQLDGLGRTMPFTFAAFLVASLSIIGIPPLGGAWSKWFLMLGAAQAQQWAMIAVLMISSLLTIAYLLPVPLRGFFGVTDDTGFRWRQVREAPWACVVPLCLTALASAALFFLGDGVYRLLLPITGQP